MEVSICKERKDGIKFALIKKNSSLKAGDPLMIIKIDEKEVIKNDRRKERRKS